MLWHAKGGSGASAILLLHGLGATAAVWMGVQRVLVERSLGRWMASDLVGHGSSGPQTYYSMGGLAAELAGLIRGTPWLVSSMVEECLRFESPGHLGIRLVVERVWIRGVTFETGRGSRAWSRGVSCATGAGYWGLTDGKPTSPVVSVRGRCARGHGARA